MNSFVLHEFYRKKAALGPSWGVSHIAVSWEESGLSHPLPSGSRHGEATGKDTDMEAQQAGPALPDTSLSSQPPSSPREHMKGTDGGNGCKGEPA